MRQAELDGQGVAERDLHCNFLASCHGVELLTIMNL
jgi:hypothetical protein